MKLKEVVFSSTMISFTPYISYAGEYIVSECNAETHHCEKAIPVIKKWPNFKGTPFATKIDGGYVEYAPDGEPLGTTLYSKKNLARLSPKGNYNLLFSNFYKEFSSPEFLHEGADAVFATGITTPFEGGPWGYIKNDIFSFYSGMSTPGIYDWTVPEKLADKYPVLAGTSFSEKITAAVSVTDAEIMKTQLILFSGSQTATLDLEDEALVSKPEYISQTWSGLWSSCMGVHGAFPGVNKNSIYLLTYNSSIKTEHCQVFAQWGDDLSKEEFLKRTGATSSEGNVFIDMPDDKFSSLFTSPGRHEVSLKAGKSTAVITLHILKGSLPG